MARMPRDLFDELVQLHERMDQLMGGLLSDPPAMPETGWSPPLEVFESDQEVLVRMELAGVDAESLEVTLEGQVLTIRGTREPAPDSDDAAVRVSEIRYGSFERKVRLPDTLSAEDVSARLNDGMLQVRVKKTPPGAGRRRVIVQ